MGCIEMQEGIMSVKIRNVINRNMGCIEIATAGEQFVYEFLINRNMGCIEICFLPLLACRVRD